jgi:hypothetical protein
MGVLLLLLASLPACTTPGTPAPWTSLDKRTGATVTVAGEPLVFARERTELAAHARDYVTLVTALLDTSGHFQYVLVCYQWSTVDARLDDQRPDDRATLIISADDRRFVLTPAERSSHDIGLDLTLEPPPGPHRRSRLYLTDLPTLRFLVAARAVRLQVSTGTGELTVPYQIWRDGRGALGALLSKEGGR